MNPKKETAMLLDIKYIRPNKRENIPDYLYIVWRDTETGEKHLQIIEKPKIDIYFEKNEFRNHNYCKNYARIETLDKVTCEYSKVIPTIVNEIGDEGIRAFQNALNTRNYEAIRSFYLYPYVFGADYDCASWYRIKWMQTLNNNAPKKLHKGFLDIEVDGLEVPGMPSPQDCPINAVTIIDEWSNSVYTFLYMYREYIPKDTTHMTEDEKREENERKKMYENMHKAQHEMQDNPDKLINKLHSMFDESYGVLDYNLYFYTDERKMLVHIFQLINKLKPDFMGIWNISFDIPYIIDRMKALNLDPTEVMSHPDFPVKQCRFKPDTRNHEIKKKQDSFHLTSYTTYYDQMELYASIRKGGSELRSYRLNVIANKELRDSKLDYSEDGDIKTLPYTNYELFVIYNIKDVLLQLGIERRTSDFDTLYTSSYNNATAYDAVFKQTITLRNVQYLSFLEQGLIPGNNVNIFNITDNNTTNDKEDDDDDDSKFEGALVADPQYNDYVGIPLYGRKTNNIFANGIDFDMSAFYPSSIFAMNIDPSTLIFKTIMPIDQFDMFGGSMKFKGITKDFFEEDDDGAKECMDNFQTGNYMTTGSKWLNLPNISKVYKKIKNEFED